MSNVTPFPEWRAALAVLQSENKLTPGAVISVEWLRELLECPVPKGETSAAEVREADLLYVRRMKDLKDELLIAHNIHLHTDHRGSLVVVPPNEQTQVGVDEGRRLIIKGLRHTASVLSHVDHSALTADERAKNADALAKLANLNSMVRRTKLISS